MLNAPGSVMLLLRCYAFPRPNGPGVCTLAHATSPAMIDWLARFKCQGLIKSDVTIEILVRGKPGFDYLTEKGVAFVQAICCLDPNASEVV